jgi:CheY-like chemotaxis protein
LVGYRFEGVDGVDLINQIRALDHRQAVAIVMVTGIVDVSIMVAALTAGAETEVAGHLIQRLSSPRWGTASGTVARPVLAPSRQPIPNPPKERP